MEKLLEILKTMPEYQGILNCITRRQSAAITGIGQINRSHMIAGLHAHADHPIVVICQDELAARRLQEELKAFCAVEFPLLPSRELTLYDSAVVSRSWEQKRLRQLYDLANGDTTLQIMSWEAMSQRTIPPSVLQGAVFCLETLPVPDTADVPWWKAPVNLPCAVAY